MNKTILCVLGTRPEAIKMAPVIHALRSRPDGFNVRVLNTAQHREMVDDMLRLFDIQPDFDLNLMTSNQTLSMITSGVITKMDEVLEQEQPDVLLAQGDTTTVLASSISAFYHRVAFGHVEAGLRSGSLEHPYPEEFNRRGVAITARYNFAPTVGAAQHLTGEGVDESTVFITGNTVIDALVYVLDQRKPTIPPPEQPYVLMTCHRRENWGAPMERIFAAVAEFATRHADLVVWYPVHPNPRVKDLATTVLGNLPNVQLTAPIDYASFLHALKGCRFALSDSGGVQEESSFLGKPCLIMREVTERPEAVSDGSCRLVGTDGRNILETMNRLVDDDEYYNELARTTDVFGTGHAAEKIVEILDKVIS